MSDFGQQPGPGPNDWNNAPQQPQFGPPPGPRIPLVEPMDESDIGRTMLYVRMYLVAQVLLLLGLIALFVGVGFMDGLEDADVFQAIVMSFACMFGIVLNAAALWMPRTKWSWTLGIVILGMGVSSCCLPLALPLFMMWAKNEFKAGYIRA